MIREEKIGNKISVPGPSGTWICPMESAITINTKDRMKILYYAFSLAIVDG